METNGYAYTDNRGEVKLAETTIKRVKVIHGFIIAPGKLARPGDVVGLPSHVAEQQIRIGNAEPYVAPVAPTDAATVQQRDPVPNKRDPEITRRKQK